MLLDNDATAAAIGEYWSGGIATGSAFAALYMGTGIGAGIIVDGTVYRGSSSNAGEIGHICVDLDGPICWCGSIGCVEVLAGPAAVVAAAEDAGLELPGRNVAENFGSLARAASRGEAVPLQLLERSSRYLGVAAQTLANVLDLELVILTGPAFALAGSLYLPEIERRLGPVVLRPRQPPRPGDHLLERTGGRRRRRSRARAAERAGAAAGGRADAAGAPARGHRRLTSSQPVSRSRPAIGIGSHVGRLRDS